VPDVIKRFELNLSFLDTFSKNTQVSDLIKLCPVTGEMFHADRQTVRHDETNSPFFFFLILRTHLNATDGNLKNSDLCAACRHSKGVCCHKYGPDKLIVQYIGTQLLLS